MDNDLKYSLILGTGTSVAALLSLILTIIIGRILGPAQYGDFVAGLSVVYIFGVSFRWINLDVSRNASLSFVKGDYFSLRIYLSGLWRKAFGFGAVFLFFAAVVSGQLASFLNLSSPQLLFLSLLVGVLIILTMIPLGVFLGFHRFWLVSLLQSCGAFVRLCLGVLLVVYFQSPASCMAAFAVSWALVLLISFFQLQRSIPGVSASHNKSEPETVIAINPAIIWLSICWAGFQNIDVFFVKGFMAAGEAGIYAAVVVAGKAIELIFSPFSLLLMPRLTALYLQDKSVVWAVLRVLFYFIVAAAPFLVFFSVQPGFVLNILFGKAYAPASTLLLPYGISLMLRYISLVIANAFVVLSNKKFIIIYITGLLSEVACLLVWNDSILQIIYVVIIVQAVTLFFLTGYFLYIEKKQSHLHTCDAQ